MPITIPPAFADFPWTTGRWYDLATLGGVASATANTSLSQDVLRTSLIYVPSGKAIDRVGFNVNVQASAGKLARVGIYTVASTGLPGALVADLGTVAIDATGDKEVTVATSPPSGQWYYLAEVHNEAFTAPCWTTSVTSPIGRATVTGATQTSYFKAFTFAALPATFPASPSTAVTTVLLGARSA